MCKIISKAKSQHHTIKQEQEQRQENNNTTNTKERITREKRKKNNYWEEVKKFLLFQANFAMDARTVMSRGTRWVESNYGPDFCEASVFKGLRSQCLCGFARGQILKPAWLLRLRGVKFAKPVFMRVCSQSQYLCGFAKPVKSRVCEQTRMVEPFLANPWFYCICEGLICEYAKTVNLSKWVLKKFLDSEFE